jgi:hypothetical protein
LLVADAYRGKEISQTIWDFLEAAAVKPGEQLKAGDVQFHTGGSADLVAYVGHDGFMDFKLASYPKQRDDRSRRAIILACASKQYFSDALQQTGASPLLWTTNLMAPEAYVLSAAIDGWMKKNPTNKSACVPQTPTTSTRTAASKPREACLPPAGECSIPRARSLSLELHAAFLSHRLGQQQYRTAATDVTRRLGGPLCGNKGVGTYTCQLSRSHRR